MRCTLCPRRCGAERTEERGGGFCGMPLKPVVARAALHRWEEPCISGYNGAGAVFFSGCSLGCVYCQNGPVSREGFGAPVSVSRLREIFRELKAQGAHNLDLVTPTHFTPAVAQALEEDPGLTVVWNSGGYESAETLRLLEGKVQVYLPDMKYALRGPAERYSHAPDYFENASAAIREMFRQTGPYELDEEGLLRRGVLIRHLLLPGELENTRRVIDWVAATFRPGEVLFSLMSQYTPQANAEGPLRRRVSGAEYRAAEAYLVNCGVTEGYLQDRSAAASRYTPSFALQGVLGDGEEKEGDPHEKQTT